MYTILAIVILEFFTESSFSEFSNVNALLPKLDSALQSCYIFDWFFVYHLLKSSPNIIIYHVQIKRARKPILGLPNFRYILLHPTDCVANPNQCSTIANVVLEQSDVFIN